ncbi:inositol-trisphosphate 3-kinase homolog isoform X2 [Chrysoperla carnea]|uniref:inositol-trisphosphate 3-kinase homolog isoform X2 n=1 Tax=Chrysoperla carnea TaxID=189513 RepID=UPI001D098B6E|nr:inositol-trisphosphate 3-kinase homolog isoform X2 [Chrysoperla carnea]
MAPTSSTTIFPPQSYTSFNLFKKQFVLNLKRSTGHQSNDSSTSNDKGLDLSELWKSRHPSSSISTTTVNTQQQTKPQQQQTVAAAAASKSSSLSSGFKKWRRTSRTSSVSSDNVCSIPKNNRDEEMSLLKFLAINALDLTAPASDILLKNRSDQWFQLSGHPDSLAPAGPGTVWKKRAGGCENTEREVYEALSADPLMKDVIPRYFREVDYQGEKFIELQDLLHGFKDPNVMDIKMGTRTFLESEVDKTTARSDLYKKMVTVDPNAPTEEEHEKQAVTKLRYMQFREQQSSSCSQGFRIEAMKCRGSPPVTDLKRVKSRDEVLVTLSLFIAGREYVRKQLIERLKEIRSKFEQSEYFRKHEVIGSSIFMLYDDDKVGVWMIDFAKTNKVPEGVQLTHRKPWVQGNHEEGFLFGLDQLISVLEEIKFDNMVESNSCNSIPPPTSERLKVTS